MPIKNIEDSFIINEFQKEKINNYEDFTVTKNALKARFPGLNDSECMSLVNIMENIDGSNRGYLAISSIDDCIAIGDEAFANNDYITASIYYDYAKTLVAAWQGYLYDENLLHETLNTNETDAEIILLSALATDNPEGYIKHFINKEVGTDYLLEALISFEGVKDKRKALHQLVSRGILQKRFVFPNTLYPQN